MADIPPTSSPLSASDARRAARNAGALIVASILSKGILFLWQIALGQWLGPDDYGIYGTVVSLLAIGAVVINFGFGLIAIREIARAPEKLGSYWSAILTLQTGLSLIAYLGVLALGIASGYSDELIAYTAFAGISLMIDLFGNGAQDMLIARERMVITSAVEIAHILLRIGLAAVALLAGWSLLGVYIATILSGLIRSAVLWWANWRNGERPLWPLDRILTRHLLIDSAPLALSAFLALGYQHADKLMTTAIIGERGTGLLSPAFVINFGVVEVLSTTVLVALYPLMSRSQDAGGESFGFMVEKLSRFMLMISLPIAVVLSVYADAVILGIYGEAYAPTGGILRILIWYTLLAMVGNVYQKALLIQNRQRWLLLVRAAGLGLNIALNAFLLLRFRDPRGAALASVLTEALALGLMAMAFHAQGFAWARILGGALRIGLAGLGAAAVMILLNGAHLLVGIALGLIVYAVLVLLLGGVRSDDWDLLYRLVAAMPGGGFIRRFWRRPTPIGW